MIRPKTRFAGQTDFGFPGSADLGGHIFLDHIQELEGNGIGLAKSRIGREVNSDRIDPGQIGCQMIFAEFLENLPKTSHQKGKIIVNFLKTACDIVFFHLWFIPCSKGSEKITSEKRAAWQKTDETIHKLSTVA